MQETLDAGKSFFQIGLESIQSLLDRQVGFASRRLPVIRERYGKMFITWPNLISLTRVPIVEAMAACHAGPKWISILLLLLAAYTDLFDGMLARCSGKTTRSGEILDPTCDKYLAVRCLMIYRFDLLPHLAWAIIGVDLFIFLGPMLLVAMRLIDPSKIDFKSTIVGKTKFFLQCMGVGLIVVGLRGTANIVLSGALLLALWSIGDKVWQSIPALRKK